MFVAIALVKLNDTSIALNLVVASPDIANKIDVFRHFIHYFWHTWLGTMSAVCLCQPIVKTSFNCFNVTKKSRPKTTSAIKGWHKQFNNCIRAKDPFIVCLFKFLCNQKVFTKSLIVLDHDAIKDPYKFQKQLEKLNALKIKCNAG